MRLEGSELSLFSPIDERCIILSCGEHPESKTASFDRANRRRHCSDFPIDTHIVGIARRDTQYRAILKTCSDVLKPGIKRSEVENYFIMSKYVSFRLTEEHEDSVQIAHEGAGRVCQEQLVYFTFEFATVEPK